MIAAHRGDIAKLAAAFGPGAQDRDAASSATGP